MADHDHDNNTKPHRGAAPAAGAYDTGPAPQAGDMQRAQEDIKHRQDEAKRNADKAREEGERKIDEGRAALRESERKQADAAFDMREAELKAEREKRDEAAKETERRSKLSPEELAAEISPFAATGPHFTTLLEPHHAAEFILSEANGQRSRGNGYFADPTIVYVGTPAKQSAPGTTTQPPTYVVAAAGADCEALCLYAGGSIPGEGLRAVACLRDAEINGNCINWGRSPSPSSRSPFRRSHLKASSSVCKTDIINRSPHRQLGKQGTRTCLISFAAMRLEWCHSLSPSTI